MNFEEFFQLLHGCAPFPWQQRLADRVCNQGWPKVIALPTGSGKTACLDIATYAMAFGKPLGPRRVFYVVDRRLVVSEAFLRMQKICKCLDEEPALSPVRQKLLDRAHPQAEHPLQAYELRGGTYLDNSWVRSPLQPLLAACTVDQLGSRLLFRAYGVSDTVAPIHAALVANDSLILLDEAHASHAFSQTLEAIEDCVRQRRDTACTLPPALQFVEMTATPSRASSDRFELDPADRAHPELARRLHAPKPVHLIKSKFKRNDATHLAQALADTAIERSQTRGAQHIAVICNRVQTARLTHDHLRQTGADVLLLTGRMRPWDRDQLYKSQLQALKSGAPRPKRDRPLYVVATQTLEVGADLDFDALVTELASLDALLQRFGRLNRMGKFGDAGGAIVATAARLNEKDSDPIYGKTIPATWRWLNQQARDGVVSLQLENPAAPTVPSAAAALATDVLETMTRLGPDAPILLPAHLDALAQTSPRPVPEPEISLFLHGAQAEAAEAQIVWRADLTNENRAFWPEIVSFCPPRSIEAFPVRFGTLKRWLAGVAPSDATDADVEGAAPDEAEDEKPALDFQIWRKGKPATGNDIRPGDTLVVPATVDLPETIALVPAGASRDIGDQAALIAHRRLTLRLHPNVIATWPDTAPRVEALSARTDLDAAQALFSSNVLPLARAEVRHVAWSLYPSKEPSQAFVRMEARFAHKPAHQPTGPVKLAPHLRDVEHCARLNSGAIPGLVEAVAAAASRHDWGKADSRFQAMLRGGDALAGRLSPVLLAKSGRFDPGGAKRAELPDGFRHELLSFLLANKYLAPDHDERDLILHLIASHHGYCRPFPPVVFDNAPRGVALDGAGNGESITANEITAQPAHRLDSGIADRFWSLTRRFGWWGLPYIESMLRLADWEASAADSAEVDDES